MASWGTPLRTLFNNIYDSALHYINVNVGSIAGSGLATEAKQDDGIALLTTIDADTSAIAGVDFATETTQATLALETGGNLAASATVLGTTADAAIDSDTTGTLSGKLRGLVKIFADVWDSVNHLLKVQEQSPVWSRYTAWVQLVTSAQDLTGAMATMGALITVPPGYKYLRIPFQLDGNDSRSVQIQVVYEIAAAGSLVIPYDPNKWTVRYSTLDTAQKIRTLDGTVSASLDDWFSLEIELDNANPVEIKVQVMAGTVGGTAGQIDNAYYSFGY